MEYKEIYDELQTVLWGDEIAKTESKDEIGVDRGYLIKLYDPFHNSLSKIDPIYHDRVFRIFRKFADKLYLETKDKYVIELMSEACLYVESMFNLVDMMDIEGTDDDPGCMFDQYKPEEAKEPKPEDKYSLISKRTNDDGSCICETKNFKFYEEAKEAFDEKVKCVTQKTIDELLKEYEPHFSYEGKEYIIEKNHFKMYDFEFLLKKR